MASKNRLHKISDNKMEDEVFLRFTEGRKPDIYSSRMGEDQDRYRIDSGMGKNYNYKGEDGRRWYLLITWMRDFLWKGM